MTARPVTKSTAAGMLIRGFLAQNVAIGCAFGGYAISILALEDRFDTTRAMAEMALAMVILSMSLLAPVAGRMITHWGLKPTMTLGVVISGLGYTGLALSPSLAITLVISGLLIGPGAALFGSIPASILASSWYPQSRGRALGIVNVPLFIALIPILGIAIIGHLGLSAFYLTMAGMHLLLLPVVLGISEPAKAQTSIEARPQSIAPRGLGLVLANALFWMVVLCDGLLNAANITNSGHIVPIAVEGGFTASSAAFLLAMGGGASIAGSLLAGYLCDRIGAIKTLFLAGIGSGASWALLPFPTHYPNLVVAMLFSGICGAAVFPPTNILLVRLFGERALPQVLGLVSALTLPLTFAMSPMVGAWHDRIGHYSTIAASLAAACLLAGLGFLVIGRRSARLPPLVEAPS